MHGRRADKRPSGDNARARQPASRMNGFSPPTPPDRPTLFFVGVSTGGSFINRLFPVWADCMNLGPVVLQGIDLPPNAAPADVIAAVTFLKNADQARGALVTTHKIAVHDSAHHLFASLDRYATQLGEVGCITKTKAGLVGAAKDPVTAGLALDVIVAPDHWAKNRPAQALLLGCGGAGVALAANLLSRSADKRPAQITLTDVSAVRVTQAHRHLAAFDPEGRVGFRTVADADETDHLVAALPEGSLVVNGTGLGKDRPGSPVTDSVRFPSGGVVWEFNYRGELRFLTQAKHQKDTRHLIVADGWRYFLFGWSHVIAEVFDVTLDDGLMRRLEAAAERVRHAA